MCVKILKMISYSFRCYLDFILFLFYIFDEDSKQKIQNHYKPQIAFCECLIPSDSHNNGSIEVFPSVHSHKKYVNIFYYQLELIKHIKKNIVTYIQM